MELHPHGLMRIMGQEDPRTKMAPEEILMLLEDRAVVDKGSSPTGYLYNLYYSMPDKGCRIAVLVDEGRTLLSVWPLSPTLLKRYGIVITKKDEEKAKRLFDEWLAKKLRLIREVTFTLEIKRKDREPDRVVLGDLMREGDPLMQIVKRFRPRLSEVVEKVEKECGATASAVRYTLFLEAPGWIKVPATLKHATLRSLLEAASA